MKDKIALITGATGALGSAVARAFVEAGSQVVLAYRSKAALDKLSSELQADEDQLLAVQADVLDEGSVKNMTARAVDKFGRIDFLVNTVGGFLGGVPVAETEIGQWQGQMEVNLKSAFLCCKHAMAQMQKQQTGRIINIGGRSALEPAAGMSAYAASKAALLSLTQTLAEEGRKHNINSNVIVPSIIDTPDNREAMPDADFKKWVSPGRLAAIILFLCSDEAADVSGAIIPAFGKA